MSLEEILQTLEEMQRPAVAGEQSFELRGAISRAADVARRDVLRSTCPHERTDESTSVVGRRMHRRWCLDCGKTLSLEEV